MICIVDYQMGNLRSVQKAFEKVGHPAIVTSDPVQIGRGEKIVLPGVGAFRDAIDQLKRRRLVAPIRDAVAAGTPLLGICLGLQLLFDISYEGGAYEGLGIVPGDVVRFESRPGIKVPHMGWNQVDKLRDSPILAGIPPRAHFYFVHSYYVRPQEEAVVALTSDYPDPFCAMIGRGRLFATQFHPEKSQRDGLRLLKNFGDLAAS